MNDLLNEVRLLSGNEAVALAARDAGVFLGTGYPGTPSSEVLESFSALGGSAQWAPNEKTALETAIGVSFGNRRALCTMKHVGLNVAADPFFTVAYAGTDGGLVIISADDPGMWSSQNEQDNRHYAHAAGVPMFEPSDSQEAYDFLLQAFELSERFKVPVLFRVTTRVCHSKSSVRPSAGPGEFSKPQFRRAIKERVMIPAHARAAHRRLREKLAKIEKWGEACSANFIVEGSNRLGVITSGISYAHVKEAAPDLPVLKLSLTYPLCFEKIREFRRSVERCVVVEEGDSYLVDSLRAAGIEVESKPECFRFGELNVSRVRSILNGEEYKEPELVKGKPPELCSGCPHRKVFEVLREADCIVAGDIGCYTLGALPPFEAMHAQLCMGASIGMGSGLRRALAEEESRKVVSVIGDSTFIHSGISGLVDLVYNPPTTGHVVLILDNGITAMTGLQEHPASGRRLDHTPAARLVLEELVRAVGIERVFVVDQLREQEKFKALLLESLDCSEISVIIARRSCVLAAAKMKKRAKKESDHNG